MFTLQNFYKSDEWARLLRVVKAERLDEKGDILCEYCGNPIVKAYDCIGHHKIELTEQNVNDYSVSLNPDNIMLVHHRCHNIIHERWGHIKPKEVYLVYGPPCAGKSSWVRDNAGSEDLVLDIDNIWEMISINPRYKKPGRLKANVFGVRDCLMDMIRMRSGNWKNAYVIGGYPLIMDRERICERLGVSRTFFIFEKKEVCLERAKASERVGWEEYINQWFDDWSG